MYILELKQQLEVDTPRGRGRVMYITEYGMEIEKLFTVIIDDSGEIWEFTNRDIRAVSNISFGRQIPRKKPQPETNPDTLPLNIKKPDSKVRVA